MDLSVIIVNYNVKYFLEQCLYSVFRALANIQAEVFVVDNNSVDGSCTLVQNKFPSVRLIENKENLGFSKASNQALRLASGNYCLLLNPDTLVEENSFEKCIAFMESHPEAGALGVKMINGNGKFLPESKRSLPTPQVAFFKIFGLSSLFPHSKLFGRYHLGYLDKDKTHPVDILSGAFMFIRKEALVKTGLLDEDFFMYGEDIDLSYRLIKNGFTNYYFPESKIIHYKGESTKKGSLNYVLVFYKAMIIFAGKHFSPQNVRFFTLMIHLAVYFRAFLAISRRIAKKLYQPVLDIILIFAGFYFLIPMWEKHRFAASDYYPHEFYIYAVPSYILIWIATVYLSGGYKKPVNIMSPARGILYGTIIILVIYALLPDNLRFSRALIFLGASWGLLIMIMQRFLFKLAGVKDYTFDPSHKKKIILIGLEDEASRVEKLYLKTVSPDIAGYVFPGNEKSGGYLGNLSQLHEIIKIHRIEEVVFCARDVSSEEIIRAMTSVSDLPVDIKIAPPHNFSIIGNNFLNESGELNNIFKNSIGLKENIRKKRFFDVISSTVLIIILPVFAIVNNKAGIILRNALRVLKAEKTWVSYQGNDTPGLPVLKKGVYSPVANPGINDGEIIDRINVEYASNYNVFNDLQLLLKNIFSQQKL